MVELMFPAKAKAGVAEMQKKTALAVLVIKE
jgi:hypothetical protein